MGCKQLLFLVAVMVVAALAAGPAAAGARCSPSCLQGRWCEPPVGRCADTKARGTCVRVPQVCTRIYRPVCGCNGKTYGNDCERRAARVGKRHEGRC
jgi:hypothetical protein